MEVCQTHSRIESHIQEGHLFRDKLIKVETKVDNHENWLEKIDKKMDSLTIKVLLIVSGVQGASIFINYLMNK